MVEVTAIKVTMRERRRRGVTGTGPDLKLKLWTGTGTALDLVCRVIFCPARRSNRSCSRCNIWSN